MVLGKTGSGKSNWVKDWLAELMKRRARIVVFDVCDEYSIHGHASGETKLGPLTQRVTADELIADPDRYLDRKDLALAVVPENEDDPEEVADDFCAIGEQVKHTGESRRTEHPLIFVIEEIGYFGEYCREYLKAAATMWRKQNVCIIFVSQRATMVPLGARSQATQIYAFQQDEQADLKALDERCGLLIPDFAERVSRCAPGEPVVWRDDLQPLKETAPCPT